MGIKHIRRFLIGYLILACYQLYPQEELKIIDIAISNGTLPEIFREIESKAAVNIYFLESWFEQEKLSLSHQNIQVQQLLDSLLINTDFNSFKYDSENFVITRNRIIYNQLPNGFFGTSVPDVKLQASVIADKPILLSRTDFLPERNPETFFVGKQQEGNSQTLYTLSGRITQMESGAGLADATVRVSKINVGDATDSNGFFSLKLPPGIHQLETRYVGMQPLNIRVVLYGDGFIELKVAEGIQQLEEVVVEATQNKNVEEVLSGTDRINSEDSKEIPLVLGERNLLKVATTLPGISTAGEGAIGINVRGGRADQNLFLLNRATLYNPTHFFGIFEALNPFVVDRVDIYKGVVPVNFGGRLSGVFDMQTKTGNTSKVKGEGSVGPVTSNLAFEIPGKKGKSSLVLGGRLAYSDWILRSLKEAQIRGKKASFYDVIATYSHVVDQNNKLRTTAYNSGDTFSLTRDSILGYNNRLVSVEWNRLIGDKHNTALSLTNSKYDFNLEYYGNGTNGFGFGFTIAETQFSVLDKFRLNQSNQVTFGLSGKLYALNPGAVQGITPDSGIIATILPEERAIESGVFFADRITFNERLELDVGLRWSFYTLLGPSDIRIYPEGIPKNLATVSEVVSYEPGAFVKFYNAPELRTSLRYFLSPDISIRAGYNTMYQYLHALSNTTTVSPIDTWKLSDNNISPQRSRLASLGIFHNIQDKNLELSLEGYYKESDDVLDFKSGARILLNEQIETEVLQGIGKSYGAEFLIRKTQGRLNGWMGYTWSRSFLKYSSEFVSEQINDGEFFPSNYDRPHDFNLIANYRFTRRYSASLNFAYQTGRPITYPIGQYVYNNAEYVVYSERNRYRIPDYYRLDLGINVEGNHKKNKLAQGFWTFSVYNVLGRNNPYSVFFVTKDGEAKALQSSIFAVPVPSITYNFKF